jgi:hypothetical protein
VKDDEVLMSEIGTNYAGLIFRYDVNRPLTEEEIKQHLPQKDLSYSKPLNQSRLIRINSTYLECVDKFFMDKGILSAAMIFCIVMCVAFIYLGVTSDTDSLGYSFALGLPAIFLPLLFLCIKLLFKECFTYTHFPIRFNRKTRKVHVFRQNGTVMTEDWGKLYFTLCRLSPYRDVEEWEVRGHRMAEDGVTVLETFGLPFQTTMNTSRSTSLTWSLWEYIRSYMEEPEALPALVGQIEEVIDIADKRESFGVCYNRHCDNAGCLVEILAFFIIIPLSLFYVMGHWIANYTSRIPKWPKEIEDECQIEIDDPYVCEAAFFAMLDEKEESKPDDSYVCDSTKGEGKIDA